MTKEQFYNNNEADLDSAWADYCFYDNHFPYGDASKLFNNEKAFWEFVENEMEKL